MSLPSGANKRAQENPLFGIFQSLLTAKLRPSRPIQRPGKVSVAAGPLELDDN